MRAGTGQDGDIALRGSPVVPVVDVRPAVC
jgi:hypothetical protein